MSDIRGDALSRTRLNAALLIAFGAMATALTAMGVFGLLRHYVAIRTREIGLRMALGADPVKMSLMIMWQGLRPCLLGLVVGISGALLCTRLMTHILYGVKPNDPLTFVAVPILLIVVAAVATLGPALRAARTSPADALRLE